MTRIDECAACLDVNEIGIIGFLYEKNVKFYGVNGDLITEYQVSDHLNSLKFVVSGDFVIETYDKKVVIRDFIRNKNEYCLGLFGAIDSALHESEKSLYFSVNSNDDENFIGVYTFSSKEVEIEKQNVINDLA